MGGPGELEQRDVVGATPDPLEIPPLTPIKQPQGLLERSGALAGLGRPGQRLDERAPRTAPLGPAPHMEFRLAECGAGCGSIALLECRPAEAAEVDSPEGVPVHAVRPLSRLESGQALPARLIELAHAAEALPQESRGPRE